MPRDQPGHKIGHALAEAPAEQRAIHGLALALQKTGQLTLSNYVIHLTLGMLLLAGLTGKHYTELLTTQKLTAPGYILGYSFAFYLASVVFSTLWRKRFRNGPLETVMRKIAG